MRAPWFATYVGLEAEASAISAYRAEIVPGLLQTRRYAAALHRAAMMNATEYEIDQHVAIRMERQARLEQPDAPQVWVVLNEAAICRMVGDREIMREQLLRLAEAASGAAGRRQWVPCGSSSIVIMGLLWWEQQQPHDHDGGGWGIGPI